MNARARQQRQEIVRERAHEENVVATRCNVYPSAEASSPPMAHNHADFVVDAGTWEDRAIASKTPHE
ncbi:hypothetical protein [Chroococcidiopsis sp. SAG 2025]|uniref:hypothetical protein n=1 Tax=Chroococcidiopsis sp. SAG 2025 TaxID=171389 RepID=UPI002936F842|nr:hypothetical protein [Chroococcidiopsis sp. SAG 2025]